MQDFYSKCLVQLKGCIKKCTHDSSQNVESYYLGCLLVAGCSMGHKSSLLHVNEWDIPQTSEINVKHLERWLLSF